MLREERMKLTWKMEEENDVGRADFSRYSGDECRRCRGRRLIFFYCRTRGDFGFCRPHPYCKPHPLYEDAVSAGAILGNVFQIFRIGIPGQSVLLAFFGLFAGIFVGCWSMALAEILNVFPIFMRRARIVRYAVVFILMLALGKGIGAGLFFWKGW